jgi:uncharacterized protein (TIGR02453 family)
MPERAFTGWPRGFVEFLTDLEANNDRDWFKANRWRYDALLRDPMTALGEDLRKLGRPHLFRPYNDTRFHPGPPIKEHQGLALGRDGAGGYYVEISLDGLLVAAGLYAPESDQVERMRAAVADGRRGGALKRAIEKADAAGLELGEPDLKRVPRGYSPEHPRADLLRYRRMVVYKRTPLAKWMSTRACAGRIEKTLAAATPLVSWTRNNVGPSQKAPRSR